MAIAVCVNLSCGGPAEEATELESPSVGRDGASSPVDAPALVEVVCAIELTGVALAERIPTVGVIEFDTDLPGITEASVHFGRDSVDEFVAPVRLGAPRHRALLLGMKQNTEYHFRIVVRAGNQVCFGPAQSLTSGALGPASPLLSAVERGPSGATPVGGFVITTLGLGGGNWAYIFDSQGDVVWAYEFPESSGGGLDGMTRARLSWDGAYLFARDVGVFDGGTGGSIYRVSLDGGEESSLGLPGGSHHDFTTTPFGIAYLAKTAAGECDCIFVAKNDGSDAHSILDLWTAFSHFPEGRRVGGERCHANAIVYDVETDSFTVSDRERDAIVQVSRQGEILATFGQSPIGRPPGSHFLAEGATSLWRVQHGHQLLSSRKLLVFSNESTLAPPHAALLLYELVGTEAQLQGSYTAMGASATLGDAQFLPNGHFLVTASDSGTMDEVDVAYTLVRRYRATRFGYATHTPTLYGTAPVEPF